VSTLSVPSFKSSGIVVSPVPASSVASTLLKMLKNAAIEEEIEAAFHYCSPESLIRVPF